MKQEENKCTVCGSPSIKVLEADFTPDYENASSGDKYNLYECTNEKCKHPDKKLVVNQ